MMNHEIENEISEHVYDPLFQEKNPEIEDDEDIG